MEQQEQHPWVVLSVERPRVEWCPACGAIMLQGTFEVPAIAQEPQRLELPNEAG